MKSKNIMYLILSVCNGPVSVLEEKDKLLSMFLHY